MIDPNTETLVSLSEAAKLLPTRRAGKKVHPSCLYRWTTTGCRGVILESIQVGGTRCTSKESLALFFHRLTQNWESAPKNRQTPAQRRRAAEAAERELTGEGL